MSFQNTDTKAIVDDNLSDAMERGDVKNANNLRLFRQHPKRIGISIVAGYGCLISNSYYFGGEILTDVAKNDTRKLTIVPYGISSIKNGIMVPTIALRIGMYSSQLETLMYLKIGRTCLNNEIKIAAFGKTKVKNRKYSDIVGIGVEKRFSEKNNIRIELEYRLSANKIKSHLIAYAPSGAVIGNGTYQGQVKNKSRGFCARLMFIHRF